MSSMAASSGLPRRLHHRFRERLAWKLAGILGIMAAMLLLIAFIAMLAMQDLRQAADLRAQAQEQTRVAYQLRGDLQGYTAALLDMTWTHSDRKTDLQLHEWSFADQLEAAMLVAKSAEQRQLLQDLEQQFADYRGVVNQVLEHSRRNRDSEAAIHWMTNGKAMAERSFDLADRYYRHQSREALIAQQQAARSSARASVLLTVSSLLALVVGATLTWATARRLTRRITTLVTATRSISEGDLSVSIPVTSQDELGLLARSFNQMTAELASGRQRLERWNHELERTVVARTAELAQAKEDAEQARTVAEQANQLKSQFLANMSHELRTPLNSIINFTRILSAGMRGPVNEGQVDYLERVRHSGEHLLGLINDILDLSKIEAGRMDLVKEPINIGELLQGVMSTATGLTRNRPITLRQEIDENLPTIEADRTRIRQVLLNLLSNAAKFTEEGSITLQARRHDDKLILSVSDTGIGIERDDLETIFEEFRQADGTSKRRYEGTGLGLSICRKLVELHGGRIWVESTPGAGSSFSFSLPNDGATASQPAQPVSAPAQEGLPILVIDDDPAAIEIAATYLRRDGYAVHGVTDSRQALQAIQRVQPAAIILDVLMPHKDGWQLLAELRADPQLGSIPIVLYSIVEEQKLGFNLGANAYLIKPIEEDQLRSTVARLVQPDATVLVIDDDPDVIEIVTRQLEQAGSYRVRSSSNGRFGLEEIASNRPDLIILDLMMPEVDGFMVLESLNSKEATRRIPVIVLTAKDLTSQEQEILTRRVHSLLHKGASSLESLTARVSELLSRDRLTEFTNST